VTIKRMTRHIYIAWWY